MVKSTDARSSSRSAPSLLPLDGEHLSGWRVGAFLFALVLVSMFCQIDRMLPFILAESIKTDLGLSDTQIGLMTGLAFAVCYTLLSLPMARFADRGSPRLALFACVLLWSVMTALGGLAAGFVVLALTRFGVAVGEAGALPNGHALIARKIPLERRGLAIGLFSMGVPLGTMVGFIGGGAANDAVGWRITLMVAGAVGVGIALLVLLFTGPTPPRKVVQQDDEPFFRSGLRLVRAPGFRWLMIAAVGVGFAATPFYAFSAPFLIRTHGFSATQVGLAFGLLQGLMGILGTLVGGRWFDRLVRSGTGRVLGPPGVLFILASATTAAGLFAPTGWMAIALFVPGMLSFSFMLPWAFGGAHLVAGDGKQALATSLVAIASGLLGPALAPLFVGLISDGATAANIPNGLGLALLIVPAASVLTGLAFLVANRRVAEVLRARAVWPRGRAPGIRASSAPLRRRRAAYSPDG